ncbi:OmpP1/FadL family transporter [Rubritalea spongiae]|uniref:OmpP1/FadL family transporter n=1 Tax=Rubritalea spongiae TaxID=430797 RepID=A0ABW5DYL4_9BACT
MAAKKCGYYVGLTTLVLCTYTYGVGFGFEYQSTEMSARGNTGVAHTEHAAAAHYNPGALSFLDASRFEFNVVSIHSESHYDTGSASYSTDDDMQFSGSAFFAMPFEWLDRDWAVAISVTRPYGQSIDWPSDIFARNSGYSGELDFPQFGLSLSHRFNDSLGIGGTLNYSPSTLKTSSGVVLPSDSLSFEGEDDSFSANFGILYQPQDELRIGVSYRTGFEVDYEGDYKYVSNLAGVPNSSSEGELGFSMPSHVIVGFEYDLTSQWTVAAQSQWTEWSVVDAFHYDAGAGAEKNPAQWNDSWMHSLGATYSYNSALDLHFGYMYAESIVNDKYKTLVYSDFVQHFLSCGVSYGIEQWEVHTAAVYVITEDRSVSGSVYGADGDYSGEGFFINLGVARTF